MVHCLPVCDTFLTTTIRLRIFQREQHGTMKRILTSVRRHAWCMLPVFLLVLTPLSVGIQSYFINTSEFLTPLLPLLGALLPLALGIALLLFIIMQVLPERWRARLGALLLACAFLLWFQSSVVNWDYGVLTGAPIAWEQYPLRFAIDGIIWTSVIAAALFFSAALRPHIPFIAATGILVQVVSLGLAVLNAPAAPTFRHYTVSDRHRMDFSSEKNVVILLLDAFQSDVFQEILDTEPHYRDALPGLTFFRNTTAQYSKTYGAVPAMLTGTWYENNIPLQSHLQGAFQHALSRKLKDLGWITNLYPAVPRIIGYSTAFASNIELQSDSRQVYADAGVLVDLALFRGSPHFVKPFWMNDAQWRLRHAFVWLAKNAPSFDEEEHDSRHYLHPIQRFADETDFLMNHELHAPTFKFFHFNIPHEPFALNEQLEPERLPAGREGFYRHSVAGLNVVVQFIAQLQALEIYDKTMLFIVADHGGGEYNTGIYNRGHVASESGTIDTQHHQSGLPLLLAKPFGATGTFDISDAPVSMGDLLPTIAQHLGLPLGYPGVDIFALVDTTERERRYLFYEFSGWHQEYLPQMQEYLVRGHAWSPASWLATGNTFAPPLSPPHAHQEQAPEIALNAHYSYVDAIKFGMFGEGWSFGDDGGVWSDSKAPVLHLPPIAETGLYSFHLIPYTCGGVVTQRVGVHANGNRLSEWHVGQGDWYSLYFDRHQEEPVILTLDIPGATSPTDCLTGLDNRTLGVFLNGFAAREAARLPLDTPIIFNSEELSSPYLLSGWSDQKTHDRWTDGSSAGLVFNLQDFDGRDLVLRLDANAYLGNDLAFQEIDVIVNGQKVEKWQMAQRDWYQAVIPASLTGKGLLHIAFEISTPLAPCDFGESTDCRRLGFAARELVVSYAE